MDIPAELLSEVTPLPLAHIALTGDYLWNEIDRPVERFRPIRANRFSPTIRSPLAGIIVEMPTAPVTGSPRTRAKGWTPSETNA
ncbi:hypothetical protein NKI70_27215 [Mesorhizobium sp. M0500]